jgi:glycosyltransferase involved in cell wall biosynthesis
MGQELALRMPMATNPGSRRRVLILDQGEGLWGPQRGLLRLAPLLEARGFELVLAGPSGPLAAIWQTGGRPFEHVPASPNRSVRSSSGGLSLPKAARELMRTILSVVRVARVARARAVDVIVSNNHWSHLEGVLAGLVARRPVVLQLHEHHQDDALGRLRRIAVAHATRTIAVSDSIRQAFPEPLRSRVEVIRNGVLASEPVSAAVVEDLRSELDVIGKRVVVALARYQQEKGLDDLIRAAASLPEAFDDVLLVLAGASRPGDAHEAYLRGLADDLMPGRVRFLGFRDDGPALLTLADVCVLSSRVEGLPLVALEAQAAGCPLVASATGGIPEVVEHEVTGLLFPPRDIARLAAEIERVLGDPELRARLRRNGLEHIAAAGTIDRQADTLAQLLRSVT